MVETIFGSGIFVNYILPWVLVFVLFFAILEKSGILGKDKRQINAIVAAVIGLLLLAFPVSRDMIVNLIPFLAVSAVILFVFMLLYGFMAGKKEGDYILNKGLKITLGIVLGIAVVVAVLIVTNKWDAVLDYFTGPEAAKVWVNILFIAIIAGAIAAVVSTKDNPPSSS